MIAVICTYVARTMVVGSLLAETHICIEYSLVICLSPRWKNKSFKISSNGTRYNDKV